MYMRVSSQSSHSCQSTRVSPQQEPNSQIGQFWMDVNSWPTPHPEIKLILRNGKRNVSMTLHSTVLRLLADLDTAAVYQHQRLRSDFVGPDECIHSASATTRFCHDF